MELALRPRRTTGFNVERRSCVDCYCKDIDIDLHAYFHQLQHVLQIDDKRFDSIKHVLAPRRVYVSYTLVCVHVLVHMLICRHFFAYSLSSHIWYHSVHKIHKKLKTTFSLATEATRKTQVVRHR